MSPAGVPRAKWVSGQKSLEGLGRLLPPVSFSSPAPLSLLGRSPGFSQIALLPMPVAQVSDGPETGALPRVSSTDGRRVLPVHLKMLLLKDVHVSLQENKDPSKSVAARCGSPLYPFAPSIPAPRLELSCLSTPTLFSYSCLKEI